MRGSRKPRCGGGREPPGTVTVVEVCPWSAPGRGSPRVARARGRHSLPQVVPPPGELTQKPSSPSTYSLVMPSAH